MLKTEPLNNVGPLILGATKRQTHRNAQGDKAQNLKMMRALWTRSSQIEINNVSH